MLNMMLAGGSLQSSKKTERAIKLVFVARLLEGVQFASSADH